MPEPVPWIVGDHLAYMAIVENIRDGGSALVEPYTNSGSSIYPPAYYFLLGHIAALTGVTTPQMMIIGGVFTIAMTVVAATLLGKASSRSAVGASIAPIGLFIGTFEPRLGESWVNLSGDGVVIWPPLALIGMGTGESLALAVLLLLVAGLVTSLCRDVSRPAMVRVSVGLSLGALLLVHAYVSLFAVVLVLFALCIHETTIHASYVRAAIELVGLVTLLAFVRVSGLHAEAFLLITMYMSALFVIRRDFVRDNLLRLLQIAIPACIVASPLVYEVALQAMRPDSFLYRRQAAAAARDLSLPWLEVVSHELPTIVISLAAFLLVQRMPHLASRRTVMAVMISVVPTTLLLTTSDIWGPSQEPYRFLPYGALVLQVLSAGILGFALVSWARRHLLGLRRCPSVVPNAMPTLVITAVILTVVSELSVYHYAKAIAGASPIVLSRQDLALFGDIRRQTSGKLALLDACFPAEIARAAGVGPIPHYFFGLGVPQNEYAVRTLMQQRFTDEVQEDTIRSAGVRFFVSRSDCQSNLDRMANSWFGEPIARIPIRDSTTQEPELLIYRT